MRRKPDAPTSLPDAGRPPRVGAALPPSPGQWGVWSMILLAGAAPAITHPTLWAATWSNGLAVLFLAAAGWRVLVLALAGRPAPALPLPDEQLPTYTVIVPLYREAAMVAQISAAMQALDYPRNRLQVLIALEADDRETLEAAQTQAFPAGFEVLVTPDGRPRTKPRACNHALARARGEFVVVYDAEDRPEAGQLREAAATFAGSSSRLACLQAPLRIANSDGFLRAQFACEYASQFELLHPAMARLGLPFPLGGTSNHFRVDVLRSIGGWDPWNVTEDADLGFRLAQAGWRIGVIAAPTWEAAPDSLEAWLPQRSRWLKGYMQTIGVQTRHGLPRADRLAALTLTLALAVGSAALHLWAAAWLATYVIFSLLGGPGPALSGLHGFALGAGAVTAIASGVIGASRTGLPVRLRDALLAPAYWPLLTIAFLQAAARLFAQPHHWDKTPHKPWLFPTR